jgi:hypothetical protein
MIRALNVRVGILAQEPNGLGDPLIQQVLNRLGQHNAPFVILGRLIREEPRGDLSRSFMHDDLLTAPIYGFELAIILAHLPSPDLAELVWL